ncbi:MAG: hypothetical protein ACOX3E_05400 [Desulfomonilia bacterium]
MQFCLRELVEQCELEFGRDGFEKCSSLSGSNEPASSVFEHEETHLLLPEAKGNQDHQTGSARPAPGVFVNTECVSGGKNRCGLWTQTLPYLVRVKALPESSLCNAAVHNASISGQLSLKSV